MIVRIARWILTAAVVAGVSGCHVYWGAEITGRIVDAKTGQALEGAAVAVVWEIYGGAIHGSTVGNLLAQEVTTDAHGTFVIPSWGPKIVFWDGLHVSAPTLLVSHPDYYFQFKRHHHAADSIVPPTFSIETRDCECGEKEIALAKLDGDWQRYQENAESADRMLPLDSSRPGFLCVWKEVPTFAREMIKRSDALDERKSHHSLPRAQQLRSQTRCGPASGALE